MFALQPETPGKTMHRVTRYAQEPCSLFLISPGATESFDAESLGHTIVHLAEALVKGKLHFQSPVLA
jgi:hypothetical protein